MVRPNTAEAAELAPRAVYSSVVSSRKKGLPGAEEERGHGPFQGTLRSRCKLGFFA